MIKESFDNNKYTLIFDKGKFKALRHGEEWRDLTGDGMVLSMLHEVERLRAIVREVHGWVICAAIATSEDMAQNFERICEITDPEFEGEL